MSPRSTALEWPKCARWTALTFEIDEGEFVAIMGPSGSGKSTAMNVIGCLDRPTGGSYLFKGVDVGRLSRAQRALLRRHFLGFVFQGFNLLSRTSAIENVELPLIYRGMGFEERRQLAMKALERVGLAGSRWAYARRVVRRAATARRNRPRYRHRTLRSARRRADRKRRYQDQQRDHGAVDEAQRGTGDHDRYGDA